MSTLIARSYQVMDRQIEQRLQERGVGGARDRANDLLDVMLDMSESQEVGSGLTVNRALMRAFFTVSRKILSLTAVYTYLRYNFLFVCL
jgi:hypothetical protein